MPTDDPLEAAVNEVVRRIIEAESNRVAGTKEQTRACMHGWVGDRFHLVAPIGYDAIVAPLVEQFGDRLILGFDDIRRAPGRT